MYMHTSKLSMPVSGSYIVTREPLVCLNTTAANAASVCSNQKYAASNSLILMKSAFPGGPDKCHLGTYSIFPSFSMAALSRCACLKICTLHLIVQLKSVSMVCMTCHPSTPFAGNEVAKNINKNNAQHAIVFEAVSLALAMDADTELLQASVSLLGKFISVREPNIKYLGLENMVRLAEVPAVIDTIHR